MIPNKRTTRLLCLAAAVLAVGSGCFFRTRVPIPALEYGRMDASRHKNLIILLRGLGGRPEDFFEHGLIQEIRRRQLPFDILVPDAHFGYYRSRSLEERLKKDLIQPAREKGYQRIWLAGFSMGGLGSLFYLRSHRQDIDGVMLISPFMGWDRILDRIDASGGVRKWSADEKSDDWQQLIWAWVKTYAEDPDAYPPIFLGYGQNDAMTGRGPALLRTCLPADRVFSVQGGHDYKTFKTIWNLHLDRLEDRFRGLPR
jgi:pimeloyl-ACP methyl ester carboxylesterase